MGTEYGHIELRPSETHGQLPYIAGTRIRVMDVYVWHVLRGMSAHAIVDQFPHLSMADVYAAMAYYWDHRDDVHEQLSRAREIAEQNRPKTAIPQLPGAVAPDVNPIPS
jgi:uncharacterized protein (DUF433 family)